MDIKRQYCLILDLKDDPGLIEKYEEHHRNVWPEVLASIHESGITGMEIFRAGNRLVMIMSVDEAFSFEAKAAADSVNLKVREWEQLMWNYQQKLPFAREGVKWVVADRIFSL